MNKKIVIGAGILVGIVAVLMATGVFKFNVSVSPSDKEAEQKKFVLPEGWVKYTSGELGYEVAYPNGWNLQEGNNEGSRDVLILDPGGMAFVRIAAFNDSSLNSVGAIEASLADYKASYADRPNEELKEFKTEINGNIGGFGASGFMLVNDVSYQFLERGLLATNGRVLIVRGAVNNTETAMTSEEFDASVSTVKQIMDSFFVN